MTTLGCMPTSSAGGADPLFRRHVANPLLVPKRWPYPVNAVMNAGAVAVDDGTVLLCRVEDRRGISHLTVARSADEGVVTIRQGGSDTYVVSLRTEPPVALPPHVAAALEAAGSTPTVTAGGGIELIVAAGSVAAVGNPGPTAVV